MTVPLILSLLCQYINGLGYKAIQGPSNNPAPEGLYISVVAGNVRQVGDIDRPGPAVAADHKYRAIMKVVSVQFYEVEGNGETIRAIQNALQSDAFDDFVAQHSEANAYGLDTGFSVWEIGDIVDNSMQDGTFFIQQKTMTADFNFIDYEAHESPRMMSVNGTINEEPFHAEVSNG